VLTLGRAKSRKLGRRGWTDECGTTKGQSRRNRPIWVCLF